MKVFLFLWQEVFVNLNWIARFWISKTFVREAAIRLTDQLEVRLEVFPYVFVDYVDRAMAMHPDAEKAKVAERPSSWDSTRTEAVPCAHFSFALSDLNCCIVSWSCSMGTNFRSLVQTSSRIYLLRVVWCMAPATCVAGQHEELHSS